MSRYGELMYVEDESGKSALKTALEDVSAGALAYDTIPLSSSGRLDPFSPEFQSMTLEKGAMIFHMLRWEIGDKAFLATLKGALSQYTDKSIRTADFEKVAEAQSQQQLTAFFSQWVDGTGAPTFTDKYSVYRLGNNKGFRTIGRNRPGPRPLPHARRPARRNRRQDRGSEGRRRRHRLPICRRHLRPPAPHHRSIPATGCSNPRPTSRSASPSSRASSWSPRATSSAHSPSTRKPSTPTPQSSLASYRIGEVLFTQRNYQAAVNSYRDALRGDDEPRWTEVWSHIDLGKIFDITGQRDRAVNEYRLAVQTNDNTQGAVNEARQWLSKPYKLPDTGQ